jgi:glucose-6-phosphate dehydrogenase assembly protein OpcA
MEAAMIVDIPSTSTSDVGKRLLEIRQSGGAVTLSRVLTLLVSVRGTFADDAFEHALAAAIAASQEHPCRIIAVVQGNPDAPAGLNAQIRVGGDAGASEVVALELSGPLAQHGASVVTPFLLPDTPVVTWWTHDAPANPSTDPLGALATRRITDATTSPVPKDAIFSRLATYKPGDTDLAWSRITPWRAVLVTAMDSAPSQPVTQVSVQGRAEEPAFDLLAGWLAVKIETPVLRLTGEPAIGIDFEYGCALSLTRPETGKTAALRMTGRPDSLVSLARPTTEECLAEELRRLDADEVYADALAGLPKVRYS